MIEQDLKSLKNQFFKFYFIDVVSAVVQNKFKFYVLLKITPKPKIKKQEFIGFFWLFSQ